MIKIDEVKKARKVITGITRVTPLFPALNAGKNVQIKAENLQVTGSFKLRGTYYKLSKLSDERKKLGIITASSGNHAKSLAYSAKLQNIKSLICMPKSAPLSKIEAVENYGSKVKLVNGFFEDAYSYAKNLEAEKSYTYINSFNDEDIIAGNATIGLEILEQNPDVDVIVVPVGGGGLIGGIACTVKLVKPDCKVIGVEPASASSMFRSINENKVVSLSKTDTFAGEIGQRSPGNITFEYVKKYVDKIVAVDDSEIASAVLSLIEDNKIVAQGAGAASVAACMFGKVNTNNKNVVCVVSGGNLDIGMMDRTVKNALIYTGRLAEFSTYVPDKPGALVNIINILAKNGANLIKVNHDRANLKSDLNYCLVTITFEAKNQAHLNTIMYELENEGYSPKR